MHACYPPCEVCRQREEKKPPQQAGSGEGLNVGELVEIVELINGRPRQYLGQKYVVSEQDESHPSQEFRLNGCPYWWPASSLRRIPPAQAEQVEVGEFVRFDGTSQAEPVEAKEPWKPVVGEKVLVEAEFVDDLDSMGNLPAGLIDSATVHVVVGGISAFPFFSQLRPLPVVQGEILGNS